MLLPGCATKEKSNSNQSIEKSEIIKTTITYSDGAKYVGEIIDDKRNGYGIYYWTNDQFYEGEWKDGLEHGEGTYTFPNGEKYVGQWKDGLYHGQGTYTFPGGQKYVGEYENGLEHGEGTLTLSNGEKYVGEYENGLKHGQGTYTFPGGQKYVGEWKDGLEHGEGTLTLSDGTKYIGEWKNGEENGYGIYYGENIMFEGLFENGFRYFGLTYLNDSSEGESIYIGEYEDDIANGYGISKWIQIDKLHIQFLTYVIGDEYPGIYINGEISELKSREEVIIELSIRYPKYLEGLLNKFENYRY